MNREKMIDRVRKLLALSQSPNEHEAATAAARAAELMLKFELDAESLEDEQAAAEGYDPNEPIVDWRFERGTPGQRSYWRAILLDAVAEAFGCRFWFQGVDMRLVGRRSAEGVIRDTYGYLVEQVTRLAREAYERQGMGQRWHLRFAWEEDFKLGAAQTIAAKMKSTTEQSRRLRHGIAAGRVEGMGSQKAAAALVRVQEDVEEMVDRLCSNRIRSVDVMDRGAEHQGKAAGAGVSLSKPKGSLGS